MPDTTPRLGLTLPLEGSVNWSGAVNGNFQILDASAGVPSVFNRTGAISAQTGDYSFSQISGTLTLSQLPSPIDMGTF